MWQLFDNRVLFVPDSSFGFDFIPLTLKEYQFDGTLIKIPLPDDEYQGFDNW